MGKKIRVIIALAVIVGMTYWAVNQVLVRSYSGSQIAFKVGNGAVVVTNQSQEPVPVEMRSEGRTASFRIESADFELRQTSKVQGSGRNAFHVVQFELPGGQAKIDVTRGSNVFFVSSSNQRIDAVVTPMSPDSVRTTLIFTGLIILAALYYISRTLQHRWIRALFNKLARRKPQPESVAS